MFYQQLEENTQLAADYKAVGRKYAAQREFRRRWASEQATLLRKERLQQESWSEADLQSSAQVKSCGHIRESYDRILAFALLPGFWFLDLCFVCDMVQA